MTRHKLLVPALAVAVLASVAIGSAFLAAVFGAGLGHALHLPTAKPRPRPSATPARPPSTSGRPSYVRPRWAPEAERWRIDREIP